MTHHGSTRGRGAQAPDYGTPCAPDDRPLYALFFVLPAVSIAIIGAAVAWWVL